MSMSVANMDLAFGSFSSPGSSSDRALCSPDLSTFTTSPQSTFMYEQDDGLDRGKGTDSVFEFPRPMEISNLGGELNASFWSEGSLLETSFGDNCKASLWDFSGFDDISSPLQHPEDDLTPTLNELNNDDSQSFDAMLSSHNACIGSAALQKQLHANNNNTIVHGKTQSSRAGPTADVTPDAPRGQERASTDREPLLLLDTPSMKSHTPTLSSKLGARTNKDNEVKGADHLTLKTLGLQHHHHLTKLTRKAISRHRFDPGISDVSVRQKRGNIALKWPEIQSYNHEDEVDRQLDGRTVVFSSKTLPEGKRLVIKDEFGTSRAGTSGGTDGYDSHDEGLGSEHEDQDDEDDIMEGQEGAGLSDVEEEDDDACSDMSEDHGVATTSTSEDLFPPKVKSRRSEYDDLTPNPKRLLLIGNELHKLNKIIGGMIPVSALPVNARNRSRKEKNKLASRACRLKKKAQHEANKLKLFGLEKEHDRLMQVITAIRREVLIYLDQRPRELPNLSNKLNTLIKNILGQMVADHTQEFVSTVLEKTANGSKLTGGLSFLTSHD